MLAKAKNIGRRCEHIISYPKKSTLCNTSDFNATMAIGERAGSHVHSDAKFLVRIYRPGQTSLPSIPDRWTGAKLVWNWLIHRMTTISRGLCQIRIQNAFTTYHRSKVRDISCKWIDDRRPISSQTTIWSPGRWIYEGLKPCPRKQKYRWMPAGLCFSKG